jgi:hypothetical protein
MTWKSTLFLSGASVLAAWLGVSSAPGTTPAATQPPPRSAPPPAPAADIQQQAARLQLRLQATSDYQAPTRNPFEFGETPAARSPRVISPSSAPPVPPVPVAPAAPAFTLAGIGASDTAGTMAYTAVLSTPAGVVLARVGETIDGGWHVDEIDDAGMTLTPPDGRTLRLSLPK